MYTVSKDNTVTKIKAEVKAEVTEVLMAALRERYGTENVAMVRTGKTSKTNEIAFRVDEATGEDGEVNSVVVTINPSVKEFSNHTSDKGKVYVPFDFLAANAEYESYIEDKERATAEREAAKAAKRAKDEERRAKAKADKSGD